MVILENPEEFKNRFKMGKKWMRCSEAIQNIPNLKPCQFYSIGDSLVYLLDNGCFPKEPRFVGHRRVIWIFITLRMEIVMLNMLLKQH